MAGQEGSMQTGDNSPSIAGLPSEAGGSQMNQAPSQGTVGGAANPEGAAGGAPMDVDATPGAGLSPGNAPSQGINGRRLFSSQGAPTPASARRRPHVRGDLQNSVPRPRVRNANMAAGPAISGDIAPVEEQGLAQDNTFIWGTRISASDITNAALNFMSTFVDPRDPPGALPKYIQLIVQAVENQDNIVNLDSSDLRSVNRDLYKKLIDYPREVLPLFDEVAGDLAMSNCQIIDPNNPPYITMRVFNLEAPRTIRDLNPEDIDTLVSVQGMVTRTSATIPELKAAYFKCQNPACQHAIDILNLDGHVHEPEKCPSCNKKYTLALVHNLCTFLNKQMVKMQEKPNDIPEGETPHSVNLYVFDSNVDVCRPGDRVTITGTYRAAPIRVNPVMRSFHASFRTYIDVMHVQRDETAKLFTMAAARDANAQAAAGPGAGGVSALSGPPSTTVPGSSQPLTQGQDRFFAPEEELQTGQLGANTNDQVQESERRVLQLSQDPRLYERLVASLAPNIFGMEDVKKGLLCQLFGGCGKSFPGGRVRGEINCLLVGDPSVSKSQLLTYMHALAPRGMYTSGKGSSATGLTAYVTRDPETHELVLESGALVMSDRGICCIDEFDKMSDSARATLHETMEQQTVSVAKAGLISTLNARTSICACANPIGSRYNPTLSVSENINLPPTLLTRFDLIYLVLDKFDEATDLHLARHLISMYHEGATGAQRNNAAVELISQQQLKEYIAYARARITPKISSQAADELARVYASMRADGRQKKVVVATPRQLESLIRLSEAQARMRLSANVTKEHVEEATRLWFQAMSMASPGENGGVDTDVLVTGMTAARRRALERLPQDLARILSTNQSVTSVNELLEGLSAWGVTREQLVDQLRQLRDILILDERTGVVRSRSALGGGATGGRAEAPPADGPAPMEVA